MEGMEDLILTMLVAHIKYGDTLNFTKSEVDNLIRKHLLVNIDKIDCNEYGYIVLLENGYITKEQFAKKMDVIYENDHYWLIINSFKDLLSSKYDYEAKILDGDEDSVFNDSYYDNDIERYYWDKFNEETLNSIIEYCNKNELEVDVENDEGEYETIELKDNLILKDGDIYINEKFDNLNEDRLRNLIDEDGLEDLNREINWAICDAQFDANQAEIYNKIKNSVIDKIGPYENIATGKNKNGYDIYKIKIRLDFDIGEVKKFFSDADEYNFEDGDYGDLESVLREMEFFDIDKPYYDNISGSINNEYLNECIQNHLDQ
jgi:hypothetical protein